MLRTDLTTGSNTYGMFYVSAAGRISWRSNMHGLKSGSCRFWQRIDSTTGPNMLRAEIQRALRRAPRQLRRLRLGLQTRRGSNHSAAHVGESNSRSNVCPIPSRICLRAQPLKNSAGRVPQAADGICNQTSKLGSCRSPRTV